MVKKLKEETPIKDKPTDAKTNSDQEEEVQTGKRLEDLPGIGPVTANKLRDLGYSLVGLATARADEVGAEMRVSFQIAKGWVMAAQEVVMAKMTLKTATDVDKARKAKQIFFETGSKAFNALIGGGIATMRTTGLAGRYSTGKTQACDDAIVSCLSKGFEGVWIETEPDTFSLDRIKEVARERNLNIDSDKLFVCEADQIPTAKAQYLQYKIIQRHLENGASIKLVVVDSFTAKFRPGYSRREMLPVRTREFTEHFLIIDYLAARYNLAWLLTCQVIGAPDPGQSLGIRVKTGDEFYPVGGEYLLHSMNTWVGMQQIKTELWKAVLFDSSYLPRSSCGFMITKKGLMDEIAKTPTATTEEKKKSDSLK
jgi:DNA repair protein RadA